MLKLLSKIYALIGNFSYRKGKTDKAIKWFEKAYRGGKCPPKIGISYGYLQLKTGNVEKADEILTFWRNQRLDQHSQMLAKSNHALVLWKKGHLDEAVALMEEVHTDFKTTTLYGSLGYLLILKGDLERALTFNLEAYEYNDSNAIILDNLGQTYFLRGEYDKARELYEKMIPTDPAFPEAYYNYGLLLLKADQPEEALEMMKKALNYRFSFLSTVKQADIESKIQEIEALRGS
ncbi:MAG: tetratricopeptide repeat protein [Firmicutes bacterium]|nr:tetratricopeptide repeat protein [Bacillota bacterium]